MLSFIVTSDIVVLEVVSIVSASEPPTTSFTASSTVTISSSFSALLILSALVAFASVLLISVVTSTLKVDSAIVEAREVASTASLSVVVSVVVFVSAAVVTALVPKAISAKSHKLSVLDDRLLAISFAVLLVDTSEMS